MSQYSDDSDGGMLFLVHNVEGKGNEEFGKHFKDLLRFEVFSRICHHHGYSFF